MTSTDKQQLTASRGLRCSQSSQYRRHLQSWLLRFPLLQNSRISSLICAVVKASKSSHVTPITGLKLMNALNTDADHSRTKFSQPFGHHIYVTWCLFDSIAALAPQLLLHSRPLVLTTNHWLLLSLNIASSLIHFVILTPVILLLIHLVLHMSHSFNSSLSPSFTLLGGAYSWLMLDTHYPCSSAVFTGRKHGCYSGHPDVQNDTSVHGPWTRVSFLDTREHGPSRSAGGIVNDVIVIFNLQDGCPKLHPCSVNGPWTNVVCAGLLITRFLQNCFHGLGLGSGLLC